MLLKSALKVAAASAAGASTELDEGDGGADAAELVQAPAIEIVADELASGASGDTTAPIVTEGSSGRLEGPAS
mgnify:CR=1 FL=1